MASPLPIPPGFDGLSQDQKLEFIHALWERAVDDIGLSVEQIREAQRRRDEIVDGAVKPIPAAEVFAKLSTR